jgi:hypothetical protein
VGDACDGCPAGPVSLSGVVLDDACGNDDGVLQRAETILVDVTIANPTGSLVPTLTGTLSGPPGVTIAVAEAVFAPGPVPPGLTATARFVMSVGPSVLCPDAGLLFTVDVAGAAGCTTQLSFVLPLTDCTFAGGTLLPPGEVPRTSLRIRKIPSTGLRLDWAATPGAAAYDSYRGTLGSLWRDRAYDHQVSGALGAGSCGGTTLFFEDIDDLVSPGDFYYLVTAETVCGLEGPTGFDSFGDRRPAGGGCP